MTVKELIEQLQTMPQNVPVYCEYNGAGGCDTCGHGSETEDEANSVLSMDTRVVISVL